MAVPTIAVPVVHLTSNYFPQHLENIHGINLISKKGFNKNNIVETSFNLRNQSNNLEKIKVPMPTLEINLI